MGTTARTATFAITVLTALAWLAATLSGMAGAAEIGLGFIPARIGGPPVPWAALPAFLTPLSATLVHSGLIHIAFNLLIFVWCGTLVERILGKAGLIVLYVIGAYAAAAAQWGTDPHSVVPMIGASGAVSAVMGAYALSYGRPKQVTSSPVANRWINAVWLMVAWIVIQTMTGWLAGEQGTLIAIPAHIGGFAAGLALQRPLLLWHYRKA